MKLEILMTPNIKTAGFWDVTPRSLDNVSKEPAASNFKVYY
jgi:hypothetical protein